MAERKSADASLSSGRLGGRDAAPVAVAGGGDGATDTAGGGGVGAPREACGATGAWVSARCQISPAPMLAGARPRRLSRPLPSSTSTLVVRPPATLTEKVV